MSSATKSWTFDANADSWTNSTSSAAATYVSATGNPSSGCLQMSVNGSRVGGNAYWQYRGNYAGIFSISTAAVINSIGGAAGDDFHYKLSSMNGSSGITLGPVQLRTSAAATIDNFAAAATVTTAVSAWTTKALGSISLAGRNHTGQTSVIIRCAMNASMGNVLNAVAEFLIDSFTLTVDYTLTQTYSVSVTGESQSHQIGAPTLNQQQKLNITGETQAHEISSAGIWQHHFLKV